MADRKAGAYGTAGSDTSFRKTWDRAEYAAKAASREQTLQDEGRARHEAAAAGKRYVRRASTPPDARVTEARSTRLDVAAQIGRQTLVAASAGTGRRGRGAGFYCEACDLTFKDNVQFVEHENSRQHLVATGRTGVIRRATLGEVRARLAWLARKRDEEGRAGAVDLAARLEARREEDGREREERRRLRNEKRRKNKDGVREGLVRDGDGVISAMTAVV